MRLRAGTRASRISRGRFPCPFNVQGPILASRRSLRSHSPRSVRTKSIQTDEIHPLRETKEYSKRNNLKSFVDRNFRSLIVSFISK